MALSRAKKEEQVAILTDKLRSAASIVFVHYLGLSVANITKLRSSLRSRKAEMKVAKKNLVQIAAKHAGLPEVPDAALPGDIACIFSFDEPTAGPAVAFGFGKDHSQVQIVGGVFSGKVLTMSEAISLATIPSRQQLLATFAGMCRSPLVSFASMCQSPLIGFARALSEVSKKKESSPAA